MSLVCYFSLIECILLHRYTSFYLSITSDGHLDCFQLLAIMNNAARNISVQVLCGYLFLFLMGRFSGAESLDDVVNLCLAS